ncbi:ATP-binding cassette domain-containing protein, partial [Streptomyces sp. 4F14]|uniref:ATP-binding cassette domain-containing protein n=1 Tax=Streptomyces sp. 4F14 TaxID=3394380 RepID=UPI003A8BC096
MRIDIDALTVEIAGARLVDEVTLGAADGELVGLVGPNGSGKSTLLRTVAGLLPAYDGTITLDGTPVRGVPDNLAVVFQDYARSLYPWLTVRENVALPLRRRDLPRAERRAEADRILARVGLTD